MEKSVVFIMLGLLAMACATPASPTPVVVVHTVVVQPTELPPTATAEVSPLEALGWERTPQFDDKCDGCNSYAHRGQDMVLLVWEDGKIAVILYVTGNTASQGRLLWPTLDALKIPRAVSDALSESLGSDQGMHSGWGWLYGWTMDANGNASVTLIPRQQ